MQQNIGESDQIGTIAYLIVPQTDPCDRVAAHLFLIYIFVASLYIIYIIYFVYIGFLSDVCVNEKEKKKQQINYSLSN